MAGHPHSGVADPEPRINTREMEDTFGDGRRPSKPWSLGIAILGLLVTSACIAIGLFSVYVRELEPQSYAERGCPWDSQDYYECVQGRANDGFLTPGLWWFVAAALILAATMGFVTLQLRNARENRAALEVTPKSRSA